MPIQFTSNEMNENLNTSAYFVYTRVCTAYYTNWTIIKKCFIVLVLTLLYINKTVLILRYYFNYSTKTLLPRWRLWKTKTLISSDLDCVKRIGYLSPMRAAKVQASLRVRAVSPEPPLLAHTSSEWRGTFRQKARSLAPLNCWACAVGICHDGMLEDTNSLDGAHFIQAMNKKGVRMKIKELYATLLINLCLRAFRHDKFQMRMPSHSEGPGIWLSVWRFLVIHCLYERAAKVLARLLRCARSPEPSLLA